MKSIIIILFFLPLSIWAQNSQFLQNYIEFNGTKYYTQNGYFTGRSSKDTICSHDFEEKVFISTPSKICGCAVYHGDNPCPLSQSTENKHKVCRKCKEVENDSFNKNLFLSQNPRHLGYVDTISISFKGIKKALIISPANQNNDTFNLNFTNVKLNNEKSISASGHIEIITSASITKINIAEKVKFISDTFLYTFSCVIIDDKVFIGNQDNSSYFNILKTLKHFEASEKEVTLFLGNGEQLRFLK
jgi:hypothetical protein